MGAEVGKTKEKRGLKTGQRISFSNTKFFGELLIYIELYDIIGKLHIIA